MDHNSMIEVIAAHRDGKEIELRQIEHTCYDGRFYTIGHWRSPIPGEEPKFNFGHFEYRIKPEPPKPREWWLHRSGETIHVREVLP